MQNTLSNYLIRDLSQSGKETGYWEYKFDTSNFTLKIYIEKKVIVCTDLTIDTLINILHKYWISPKNENVTARLKLIQLRAAKNTNSNQHLQLIKFISEIKNIGIINDENFKKILQLDILNIFDNCEQMQVINNTFIRTDELATLSPFSTFDIDNLLIDLPKRQQEWTELRRTMPSPKAIPILKEENFKDAKLDSIQKDRILKIMDLGISIEDASFLARKDILSMTKFFQTLVKLDIVYFADLTKANNTIVIVDDSDVLVRSFRSWVETMGYSLIICQDSTTAVDIIDKVAPGIVFVDINMPFLSGFELVKEIRKRPRISKIPLVVLTGEENISTKWKTKWFGCQFLGKPSVHFSIDAFKKELESLLKNNFK